jgi:hypothetical protein
MKKITITSQPFFKLIMQARIIALDNNLSIEETYYYFCQLLRSQDQHRGYFPTLLSDELPF